MQTILCKLTFEEIKTLFETYCRVILWNSCKPEYKILWDALKHCKFSNSSATQYKYETYLRKTYDELFSCKDSVTFAEFYTYLEEI